MKRPFCVDLFCGLGSWAEGFLAEDYDVFGFDIERRPYPSQLVIQDVLTLHGSQFKDAAVIVASPPCQNYSYLAMPWSRSPDWVRPDGDGWQVLNLAAAKEMRNKWEREGPDNRLFDACFRIQREAIEGTRKPCWLCLAGRVKHPTGCPECFGKRYMERYIPLIVENVRGAQPWVGRSAWNWGSFHLWGDVPALMPIPIGRGHVKVPGVQSWSDYGKPGYKATAFNGQAERNLIDEGQKTQGGSWFRERNGAPQPGIRHEDRGRTRDERIGELIAAHGNAIADAVKETGESLFVSDGQKVPTYSDPRRNGGKGVHLTSPQENADGLKIGGDWFRDPACHSAHGSRSSARKLASAQIAKIPFELARYIASVYRPLETAA